jgi:hypothetical protein
MQLQQVHVDLTDVCHADEAGRRLMSVMHRAGVRFLVQGCVMREVVREISAPILVRRN